MAKRRTKFYPLTVRIVFTIASRYEAAFIVDLIKSTTLLLLSKIEVFPTRLTPYLFSRHPSPVTHPTPSLKAYVQDEVCANKRIVVDTIV